MSLRQLHQLRFILGNEAAALYDRYNHYYDKSNSLRDSTSTESQLLRDTRHVLIHEKLIPLLDGLKQIKEYGNLVLQHAIHPNNIPSFKRRLFSYKYKLPGYAQKLNALDTLYNRLSSSEVKNTTLPDSVIMNILDEAKKIKLTEIVRNNFKKQHVVYGIIKMYLKSSDDAAVQLSKLDGCFNVRNNLISTPSNGTQDKKGLVLLKFTNSLRLQILNGYLSFKREIMRLNYMRGFPKCEPDGNKDNNDEICYYVDDEQMDKFRQYQNACVLLDACYKLLNELSTASADNKQHYYTLIKQEQAKLKKLLTTYNLTRIAQSKYKIALGGGLNISQDVLQLIVVATVIILLLLVAYKFLRLDEPKPNKPINVNIIEQFEMPQMEDDGSATVEGFSINQTPFWAAIRDD